MTWGSITGRTPHLCIKLHFGQMHLTIWTDTFFYFDKSILIDDNPGVQGASPPTSAQGKEVMMSAAPGFHIWKGLDDNSFFEIFSFGFLVIPRKHWKFSFLLVIKFGFLFFFTQPQRRLYITIFRPVHAWEPLGTPSLCPARKMSMTMNKTTKLWKILYWIL